MLAGFSFREGAPAFPLFLPSPFSFSVFLRLNTVATFATFPSKRSRGRFFPMPVLPASTIVSPSLAFKRVSFRIFVSHTRSILSSLLREKFLETPRRSSGRIRMKFRASFLARGDSAFPFDVPSRSSNRPGGYRFRLKFRTVTYRRAKDLIVLSQRSGFAARQSSTKRPPLRQEFVFRREAR